jgi:FkbM family methyltransferase
MAVERELVALATADGIPYRLSLPAGPSDAFQAHVRGGYPPEAVARFLYEYVRSNDLVVDVGANIGTVCVPLALKGARVLAIEALRENFEALEEAQAANRLGALLARHAAAWSASGFVHVAGHSAWGTVVPEGERVPAVALDDLLCSDLRERVSAVKLDVEGSEREVLRGMAGLVRRDAPLVAFEANALTCGGAGYSYRALLRYFEDRGYAVHRLFRSVLAPATSGACQEVVLTDYVATKDAEALTRVASYEVRPLSEAEVVSSILEQEGLGEVHRHYVALVAPRLPGSVLAAEGVATALARWRALPLEPWLRERLEQGFADP